MVFSVGLDANCRGPEVGQSLIGFRLVAIRLVARGKLHCPTEVCGVFVAVKPRLVGRDLEQHAPGRGEVERPEVVTVYDRRYLIAGVHQSLANLELSRPIVHGEGDVMHRASAEAARSALGTVSRAMTSAPLPPLMAKLDQSPLRSTSW